MAQTTATRRRPPIALLVGLALSLCLLTPTLIEAYGDIGSVARLDMRWMALAILSEVVSFLCCWELLRIVLRREKLRDVAPSQLAGNAISQVVPAGGAAGAAMQLRLLVRAGCDVPTAIAGMTAAGVLSTVGFLALPVLVLPGLWTGAKVDSSLEAGVWLSVALLVVLIGTVAIAMRDRVLIVLARTAQRIVDAVGRGPRNLVETALAQRDLLYEVVRQRLGRALAVTVGQAVGGYVALYLVLVAAGLRPNVVVVLAAFAVANIAGMIPFTPAGLGFVEAGLAGVLSMAAIPYETALVIAVAYRLVSSWLPALVGFGALLWSRPRSGVRAGRSERNELLLPGLVVVVEPPPAQLSEVGMTLVGS
jgi:uncharacterized protein (TIRG00374 family)